MKLRESVRRIDILNNVLVMCIILTTKKLIMKDWKHSTHFKNVFVVIFTHLTTSKIVIKRYAIKLTEEQIIEEYKIIKIN